MGKARTRRRSVGRPSSPRRGYARRPRRPRRTRARPGATGGSPTKEGPGPRRGGARAGPERHAGPEGIYQSTGKIWKRYRALLALIVGGKHTVEGPEGIYLKNLKDLKKGRRAGGPEALALVSPVSYPPKKPTHNVSRFPRQRCEAKGYLTRHYRAFWASKCLQSYVGKMRKCEFARKIWAVFD